MKDTPVISIAEHLLNISQKYSNDIQQHPILMKMSDILFDRTKFYYNLLLFIHLFGFFLPFLLQLIHSTYHQDESLEEYDCPTSESFKKV